jgi:hypothetical protein
MLIARAKGANGIASWVVLHVIGRVFMFRMIGRPVAVAVLLLVIFGLVSCGESSQDKAKAQVCDARESISKQITTLSTLTLSIASVEQAKSSLQTIGKELGKIKEAQPDLDPARKQQVESATQTFGKEVSSVVSGLATGASPGSAVEQLKSSLTKLANSYKQTLAPVNCS